MNGIVQRQKELEVQLNQFEDWESKYKKVIEMGKNLKPMDDKFKVEEYIVKGCQSQVWLKADLSSDGQIYFMADSDALIVKGLVAVLLYVYNSATPQEVLTTPPEFLKSLGLESHLTPSRANGLRAMVQKIVMLALGYQQNLKK